MIERGAPGQIDKGKGIPKGKGLLPGEGVAKTDGVAPDEGVPKGEGKAPGEAGQVTPGAPGQVERGSPGQMDPWADNPWAMEDDLEGGEDPRRVPPPPLEDLEEEGFYQQHPNMQGTEDDDL